MCFSITLLTMWCCFLFVLLSSNARYNTRCGISSSRADPAAGGASNRLDPCAKFRRDLLGACASRHVLNGGALAQCLQVGQEVEVLIDKMWQIGTVCRVVCDGDHIRHVKVSQLCIFSVLFVSFNPSLTNMLFCYFRLSLKTAFVCRACG